MNTVCVICKKLASAPAPAFISLTNREGVVTQKFAKHLECEFRGNKGNITTTFKSYFNTLTPGIEEEKNQANLKRQRQEEKEKKRAELKRQRQKEAKNLLGMEEELSIDSSLTDSEKDVATLGLFRQWSSRSHSRPTEKARKEADRIVDLLVRYRSKKGFHN